MTSKKKSYFLAIDQGTSGTKAIIFDAHGSIKIKRTSPLKSHYPKANYVEQIPEEIYHSVLTAVKDCLAAFEQKFPNQNNNIIACGISNQRETFVLWDKHGNPLHNAVVWQCKRSNSICETLIDRKLESVIHAKTGLTIDPYFSATKVIWLYENNKTVKRAIDAGEAFFGTVDTWLLYKLTEGKSYKTDHTNASRTLFYNIYELNWDKALLEQYGLKNLNLPEVTYSSDDFGVASFDGAAKQAIPITGIIGDSQAAFFGEECFGIGTAKATLGTGCSILWNTDKLSTDLNNNMLTTIGWSLKGQLSYALEGIIVSCGATIEWLKNQLSLFDSYDEIEPMVVSLKSNEGVYLIPAFSGMGAPYWQKNWKASIHGLTFSTSKEHLLRAGLESIAYQIKDGIQSLETKTNTSLKGLKVNGGIAANSFLMQIIADLLNRPITMVGITDISAWGAAMIAGLGVHYWKDMNDLPQLSKEVSKTYYPNTSNSSIHYTYATWSKIIENKKEETF